MSRNVDGSVNATGEDVAAQVPRGTRRFFQFNLRQVLLLVALCGVLLVIVTPRIRQELHWRRIRAESDQRAIAEANLRAAALADPVAIARRAVESDLRTAVRTPNITLARQALEEGADPNVTVSPHEQTRLLLTCIANGHVELVQLLLDHGAEVDRIEPSLPPYLSPAIGGPPLFAAASCDHPPEVRSQIVRHLVAHGADPRAQYGQFNAMDIAFHLSDGQTGDLLREYGLPYGPREMAGFNRLDELKQVVKQNPEIVKERFPTTWAGQRPTLLGIALRGGYREMALFLIESGAPLDTIEHQGSTLLHEAARGGDPELIRLLVARGLDVNATDDYGDTPLCDIAGRKKPQAVAALIEAGADVNRQGINRRTPLHGAVYGGCVDVVKMLLGAGADPTLRDSKGETPLDLARTRSPKIAELLEQATFAKVPHDDD